MKKHLFLFGIIWGILLPLCMSAQESKPFKKALKLQQKAIRKKSLEERDKATIAYQEIISQNTSEKAAAYRNLGELYSSHSPKELQNLSKSMEYYQEAIQTTDPEIKANALYNLGLFHYHGQPVTRNFNQAEEYFTQAAAINEKYCIALGEMYELGLNKPVDFGKALEFYYRAAIGGDFNAWSKILYLKYLADNTDKHTLDTLAYQLYKEHLIQISVNNQLIESMPPLIKASRRGYVPAFLELSGLLVYGSEVYNESAHQHWLNAAAEKGDAIGMHNLAHQYGIGLTQFNEFNKSLQAGFPLALLGLSFYYETALLQEITQHHELAKAYCALCIAQGSESAQNYLNTLPKKFVLQKLPENLKQIGYPFFSISDLLAPIFSLFPLTFTENASCNAGLFWEKRYHDMEQFIKDKCNFCIQAANNLNIAPSSFDKELLQVSECLVQAWQKDMVFFRQIASKYGKAIEPSAYETKDVMTLIGLIQDKTL